MQYTSIMIISKGIYFTTCIVLQLLYSAKTFVYQFVLIIIAGGNGRSCDGCEADAGAEVVRKYSQSWSFQDLQSKTRFCSTFGNQ